MGVKDRVKMVTSLPQMLGWTNTYQIVVNKEITNSRRTRLPYEQNQSYLHHGIQWSLGRIKEYKKKEGMQGILASLFQDAS